MMENERRQYSRKMLNPLPYINLSPDGGGIVLDVSEQGLRFRATSALDGSGPIHFSFTSRANLIAGIGELVWIDNAKKTGGLRFTDLPYSALEQIRKLPDNSDLRPSFGKDLTLHISAAGRTAGIECGPSRYARRIRVRGCFRSRPVSARIIWIESARKVASRAEECLGEIARALPGGRFPGRNRWLFRTTYVLFLGMVISTLVYARHRQAGELLIRLGTKLSAGANTLTSARGGTTRPAQRRFLSPHFHGRRSSRSSSTPREVRP